MGACKVENKALERIRDSAERLSVQIDASSNVPLDKYVDLTDIRGIHDTLSIDVEALTTEDLERIILAREALYGIVEATNALPDTIEHSIEQLLNALNRCYVDLEAFLKSKTSSVRAALESIEQKTQTPKVPISPSGTIGQSIVNVSNEVIHNVTVNQRHINISILNGVQVDVLRDLRVKIRRLSASAFAVKVQVNAQLVYEGTIKFLTAGADKVLNDLKIIAEALKESFSSAEAIVKTLEPVIDAGTRFVKIVGSLIKDALTDDHDPKDVHFKPVNLFQSRALVTSAVRADGSVIVSGKGGTFVTVATTGRAQAEGVGGSPTIFALADVDGQRAALGTHDGLEIWSPSHFGHRSSQSQYREKITAIAQQRYRGTDTLITGSSDGALRRWWRITADLEQMRDDQIQARDVVNKVGRSIQGIATRGPDVLVATGSRIVVLDSDFVLDREIELGQRIRAIRVVSEHELVAVGDGLVAVVNFQQGVFSRVLSVPAFVDYVAVATLSENTIAVATADGAVRAIDLQSGAEVGEINLNIPIRGIERLGKFVVAYGGEWDKTSKSVVVLQWEERSSP